MTAVRRVLLTGAGGFVGRNIAEALLAQGMFVVALDRRFDPDLERAWRERAPGRFECITGDVSKPPDIQVDAVIHGAAITASADDMGQTPEAHYSANMVPLLDMLAWAHRHGVRRMVVISSGAVYRATPPGPVDETQPTAPLGLYAVAKDAAEKLVDTLRSEYERDVVVMRLSNIYGPHERTRDTRPWTSLVARLVRTALDEGRMTVGREDPAQDWTYAPDIGRVAEAMITAPSLRHHLYHAASGQVVTPLDIAQHIRRLVPAVEVSVLEGHTPEGRGRSRLGHLSSERLQAELGITEWTPFEQGLKAVIAWQQAENQL